MKKHKKQIDRMDSASHLPVYFVNMHDEITLLTAGGMCPTKALQGHLV